MLRTEREGPVNAASFKPIISEVKELHTRFLPSYNVGLVCNSMSHAHTLSCVRLFATPWTTAHQVPLSMEFSRQEYWSGLPFPTPGDLPDPRIEPISCADSLPLASLGEGRVFTPVFWLGESHGLYSPCHRKELDMTFMSLHFTWEFPTCK